MTKIIQILKVTSLTCISLTVFAYWQSFKSKDEKRVQFCQTTKSLTEIAVNQDDLDGVKYREGTIFTQVSLDANKKISVFVFPQALSAKTWSKATPSLIKYIGKGGDNNWREWLIPDNFYLLEVPTKATGLAFGRLCYRNGDVGVQTIKKLEQVSPNKILINDKSYISLPSPLPTINSSHIIVNAGSDRRDILGGKTEVYYTTKKIVSQLGTNKQ
ncbi:MAG: hypothetical protein KME23_00715 [Goleter apudmare HA4340-LM2]|jgi:hypothetical protein|nr:hypothetical protein [Goleter apudmare HA4340-LM2]